jgi:hypothetical protein
VRKKAKSPPPVKRGRRFTGFGVERKFKVKPKKRKIKTMATAAKDEKEEKKETQKGYSGTGEEGKTPVRPKGLPEDAVVSPVGITKPPEVYVSDPYRKEATKDERFAGKVHMKGKTFNGYEYEQIIELTKAVTKEGAFHAFKGHHGDAIPDGFTCKTISDEEAEKLTKEWAKELQHKE